MPMSFEVLRRGLQRVGFEHREVGALAGLDRADLAVELERVGSPERDGAQGVSDVDALLRAE